ncbi:hypothetical protein IQ235_04910 [Oscillatoriales cyanobacterium LEGE 11467]|uniref:Uncharacterized protein n=1 Tax=Zarconia navalis LEGE 11467 TaxID=1828826 RepID=A0A928Z7X3_9CYAN|nr:hypothetical protein [Zarconia navalis]MBE9040133.1 hypothetical protein [Zarconia navalis LEGE 11467]
MSCLLYLDLDVATHNDMATSFPDDLDARIMLLARNRVWGKLSGYRPESEDDTAIEVEDAVDVEVKYLGSMLLYNANDPANVPAI